jgi:pSer/pThr/pTyr-binding forkhead associated (FHA) protein
MVTARPSEQLLKTSMPGVAPGEAAPETSEDDSTIVRPRVSVLYNIEVWREGVRQSVTPISKPEITIGRGSRSVAVDLPIKGDPEVSRIHATLARDESGQYWLTSKGRNPTLLNGQDLPREQRVPISPDNKIEICSFTLRIQPQ